MSSLKLKQRISEFMGSQSKRIFFKDQELILFSIIFFILFLFSVYFSYFNFINDFKSQFVIAVISSIGFIFISLYSIFKSRDLNVKRNIDIDSANKFNSLTGIPNIYSFFDEARRKIEYINDNNIENKELYFINIGINRFKFINETFGYNYADKIIVEIKNEIEGKINSSHYLGKLNGDEFGILSISSKNDMIELINSINGVFRKYYKITKNDVGVFIDGRIGISHYSKNNDNVDLSLEKIFKSANIALEYAKSESSPYKIYNKKLERKADEIMKMEKDLRDAISEDEIDVFFQPKVDLKTGRIIGAEALARWFSKERDSYVRPDIFIELAENIGVINDIGNYVLKKSIEELKKWQNLGYLDLKVAVNISTFQFKKELPDEIMSLINSINLNPKDLELEVTESAIITDKHSGVHLLQKVKNTGVTIAIDDFGTGYSSLAYLVEFPLDIIKIDKSFIDKIILKDKNIASKGKSVISSIIHLSHSINCKVVAEGVETQEQIDFLKSEGCDYIQGYYYSKPLNSNDFILHLEEKNLLKRQK